MKKIIEVKWVDSSTYREWYNALELKTLAKTENKEITSIGYLIYTDKNKIILAQNNDNNEQFSGMTIIPTRCIIKKEAVNNGKF